jgi:hypothetical protein
MRLETGEVTDTSATFWRPIAAVTATERGDPRPSQAPTS